jgi:hypothetical protein
MKTCKIINSTKRTDWDEKDALIWLGFVLEIIRLSLLETVPLGVYRKPSSQHRAKNSSASGNSVQCCTVQQKLEK